MIDDRPNLNFSIYLNQTQMDELERQAIVHAKGVKAHHARTCLAIGFAHFKELEQKKLILERMRGIRAEP